MLSAAPRSVNQFLQVAEVRAQIGMIAKPGGKAPAQGEIISDSASTELLQPCLDGLE
jgi:hypothetical protein